MPIAKPSDALRGVARPWERSVEPRPTVVTSAIGLAAIVVVMALNSVLSVADEWSIVVDVGGPLTFVPYLVYLAGVAVIAAAGVMLAMRLRPAPTG